VGRQRAKARRDRRRGTKVVAIQEPPVNRFAAAHGDYAPTRSSTSPAISGKAAIASTASCATVAAPPSNAG
jgi:hypothetical protein